MRATCLLCVRKHLGKAEALMNEVRQGYPHHAGLAIGNLSEAADEALQDYPKLAADIRRHWKAFELDEAAYEVPTVSLLKTVEELLQRKREEQEAAHKAEERGPTSFTPSGDQLGEGEIPQATDSMREMAAGLAKVSEDVGKAEVAEPPVEVEHLGERRRV